MKFMNLKRFGATVMAGVLALSMAVPAFATSTPVPTGQVTISGTYQDIEIAVSVPTTGTAQINPYGLPVDITLSDTISKVSISGQQITSRPLSIRNEGTTKLSVNATLAVDTSGTDNGVSVKNADLTAAEDGKEINLALQVAGLNDEDYAVSSLDTTLEDNIIRAFADPATWASAKTLKAKDTAAGTALAAAAVAKSTDTTANGGCGTMAVLGAATAGAGGLVTYGNDSIAVFRLTGKVNESPQKLKAAGSTDKVDDPWTTTDKFSAQVVFKFKPAKDASVTLNATGVASLAATAGSNSGSVVATFNPGDTDLTATGYAWAFPDGTTGLTVSGTTATGAVNCTAQATAVLTCTVTLSDGTTRTASCTVTAN